MKESIEEIIRRDKINMSIAKASDVKFCSHAPDKHRCCSNCGWNVDIHPFVDATTFRPIHDYTTDLNAMHAAEKVLEDRGLTFQYQLLLGRNGGNNHEWSKIHATAAQRAEAFLKTLGLWGDDK